MDNRMKKIIKVLCATLALLLIQIPAFSAEDGYAESLVQKASRRITRKN